jgi:hypothetical protein
LTDNYQAAVGGTYEFTRFASANLRERDDSLNTAIGGFLAGSVLGLRCGLSNFDDVCCVITNDLVVGTTPAVLGFGALTAVVLGAYDYTGGALTGFKKNNEIDEFERKQELRKNRRRPIEQTISELGEGRGRDDKHIEWTSANIDS